MERELAVSKMSDYELLENIHSDKWAPNSHVGGNEGWQYLGKTVVKKRSSSAWGS